MKCPQASIAPCLKGLTLLSIHPSIHPSIHQALRPCPLRICVTSWVGRTMCCRSLASTSIQTELWLSHDSVSYSLLSLRLTWSRKGITVFLDVLRRVESS